MSEYGLRIKNIQAGSIYEYNNGVRDVLDMKNAMLTNSLFLDYLYSIGINVWKEESTRDIICIEFNYGSRSYDEEKAHISRLIDDVRSNPKLSDDEKYRRIDFYHTISDKADQNKDKFIKKSKQEIREIFYENGVDITYKSYGNRGRSKKETIHYKMLYRTPGKAKKGSCMFINERLYEKAREFLYMGIQLPDVNAPIVEIGAYSSLITSTIVDRIQIHPENILILKDVDSIFHKNVISIETDNLKHCHAVEKKEYPIKNTLFDGQALIDHRLFPEWADGYILLRHHFCKMATFDSNIQMFFKDYYGDKYETAVIKDMFGVEHFAKDIELITTDNAMKWLKFDVPYEYWCSKVHENNDLFGIVKTAHPSKLGDVQKMSYQMINALDLNLMDEITKTSCDYVYQMKADDDVFLEYLYKNQNFSNDYEVLLALVNQNRDFLKCDYFRDRKRKIINAYLINMKSGKLIQNADNLTIVGSPFAMLMHAVGEDPENDPTFEHEDGAIQCYTERFDDGEYLAEFRNPFNSRNNLGYLHNHYDDRFKKYFNFGRLIIAVNLLHTDMQDRNNGSDQDSDGIYVTNQKEIVECAKNCYRDYPTIVNNIPKESKHYNNTLKDFAMIDNNLAAAQLAIGESSNLAQICLSYTYNFADQKYQDYVCILSVLAQCAIDNAKRTFDIDLPKEIKRIKHDMNIKTHGYPIFWTIIRKGFDITKVNKRLKCPMNYMYNIKVPNGSYVARIPISDFFVKHELDESKRKCKKVEELIAKYSLDLISYNMSDEEDDNDNYLLLREDFDQLIEDIRSTYISQNYLGLMSWLIDRAMNITPEMIKHSSSVQTTLHKNKSLLFKVLYDVNPDAFLKCFSGYAKPRKIKRYQPNAAARRHKKTKQNAC